VPSPYERGQYFQATQPRLLQTGFSEDIGHPEEFAKYFEKIFSSTHSLLNNSHA